MRPFSFFFFFRLEGNTFQRFEMAIFRGLKNGFFSMSIFWLRVHCPRKVCGRHYESNFLADYLDCLCILI